MPGHTVLLQYYGEYPPLSSVHSNFFQYLCLYSPLALSHNSYTNELLPHTKLDWGIWTAIQRELPDRCITIRWQPG